jgi:thiol:disulfide interchange protein
MNMRLLFIVFCLSGFWIHAQAIEWMTFEQALEAQKETPKKILVDVYTDWCGPCKLMDKKTFQNPRCGGLYLRTLLRSKIQRRRPGDH